MEEGHCKTCFCLETIFFLLAPDKNSQWIELVPIPVETYSNVAGAWKIIFSRVGSPCELTTMNRDNFAIKVFGIFAREYGFNHKLESPDSCEFDVFQKAMKVCKTLWCEVDDINVAMTHH